MPSILGREAVPNQQTHASLGDSAPANSWLIANVLGTLGCYQQMMASVSRRDLSFPYQACLTWIKARRRTGSRCINVNDRTIITQETMTGRDLEVGSVET